MRPPSIYAPDGAFAAMLVVLGVSLVAAVVYLVVFAGASLPP